MNAINVVFDNDFTDVDILLVPEYVADSIETITQDFFNWISIPNNKSLFEQKKENGQTYVAIGTDEFIWWLRKYVVNCDDSVIVFKEHTLYCPEYPTADF